jgi:hypothetical protein
MHIVAPAQLVERRRGELGGLNDSTEHGKQRAGNRSPAGNFPGRRPSKLAT